MQDKGYFPQLRLRRLRTKETLRHLLKDIRLDVNKFIYPLFIKHGVNIKNPIPAMPGIFQWSVDCLTEEIMALQALNIKTILLFGIPKDKDPLGLDAYSDTGIIQTALSRIKQLAPEMLIITDLCFCEYTSHGHCGVMVSHQDTFKIDNDQTLALLKKQAVSHAKAGADMIAPSGNMDGMVHAIREGLDEAGFHDLPILSYAVKYASALYGPFRLAAEGAPQFGNRLSYQMDYARQNEALRECALDIAEGADLLMVKPAHTYLDIICKVKQAYPELPLGAYHTSGEFAMLKAAAEKGWIEEKPCVLEILTAIHRAGADFIITYYAKEVAKWLSFISD